MPRKRSRPMPRKSFWIGLSTQLSNPKTAVYYGSIFAALLPQHPPLWCYFALPPAIFAIEAGWYTDRRAVLFEQAAARNLSAMESLGRSRRRERSRRARIAPDPDGTQSGHLTRRVAATNGLPSCRVARGMPGTRALSATRPAQAVRRIRQNSYKLSVDADIPRRLLWHPKFKKFDCCSSMSRSLSGIRCPLPP